MPVNKDEDFVNNKLAIVKYYLDTGDLPGAELACREILAINPGHRGASGALGVIASRYDEPQKAINCYQSLIELDKTNHELHLLLGRVYLSAGTIAQAIKSLDAARQINPADARIFLAMGNAFLKSDEAERAVGSFEEAVRLDPSFTPAYMMLGKQKSLNGDLDAAGKCFETAARTSPENALTHYNLGVIRFKQGDFPEALDKLREAVRLRPDYTNAYELMGMIYEQRFELENALEMYRKIVSLQPDNPEYHIMLATVLSNMGQIDESAKSFDDAVRLSPDKILWKLRKTSLCPVAFNSSEEIHEYRSQLLVRLKEFSGKIQATPEELVENDVYPRYALTFHGQNDREIRMMYASLFSGCFPRSVPCPQNDRPRVGFFVSRSHEGVFVRLLKGIVKHLDRKMFEPVVICTENGAPVLKSRMTDVDISFMVVPDPIDQMAEAIANASFDILYHWEVATDPVDYFLPFYRLAPAQCASWGVQVTSGIPNVDYYLSCELAESEHAQDHYSERLLLSDTLLTYQYPRQLPACPKTREEFGFGEQGTLYVCPQMLGKIHPEFDNCLGEILRRDPEGRIVLIGGRLPYVVNALKQRFQKNIPDVLDRIVFLPRLDEDEYASLIAVADLLLDPHRYGGVTTTYDGLSFEKPIVTMPTVFQIGRYSSACLRLIGATECIVSSDEEYIDTAVRIGTDQNYRQKIKDKIRASSHLIFRNMNAVREHERLFTMMLQGAK